MKNGFKILSLFLVALVFLAAPAQAQTTTTQTTTTVAISNTTQKVFTVTSATGFVVGYKALIDTELMDITAISGTTITVNRGVNATAAQTHASGATIYVGPSGASPFISTDKVGTCTSSNELYLPQLNYKNGRRWNCINSTWMVDNGVMELPASACFTSVSGNSTGTNGYTTAGTSLTPVVQAQTSTTGTNTHYYICNITIPSFLAGKGAAVTDVVFKYGVQTTALGTQAVTLASGTLNSTTVFSYIDFPAPGASETASTVAPVRADSGTLTLSPVAASFNVATTTAGAFYTEKFTPASAIPVPSGGTDRRQLLFTVALLNTATSATVTNSPGLTVHYAYVPNEVMIGR